MMTCGVDPNFEEDIEGDEYEGEAKGQTKEKEPPPVVIIRKSR